MVTAGAGGGAGAGSNPSEGTSGLGKLVESAPASTPAPATSSGMEWVCRVFTADGTAFDLPPPPLKAVAVDPTIASACGATLNLRSGVSVDTRRVRKRKTRASGEVGSTARSADGQGAKPDGREPGGGVRLSAGGWYDKVLVDAECTHDGSIKHISKFHSWGWPQFEKRFLNPERLRLVVELQKRLARWVNCAGLPHATGIHRVRHCRNGFRLLKPGGVMVYSTCSLTTAQNEGVVQWLLDTEPTAQLVPVGIGACSECSQQSAVVNSAAEDSGLDASLRCPACSSPVVWQQGSIPLTLRFDPLQSLTSGLFVAKFTKRSGEDCG